MAGYPLSLETQRIVGGAKRLADEAGDEHLSPGHVWEALLLGDSKLAELVRDHLDDVPAGEFPEPLQSRRHIDSDLQYAMKRAAMLAEQQPVGGRAEITPLHLCIALLGTPQIAGAVREPQRLIEKLEQTLEEAGEGGVVAPPEELVAAFQGLGGFGRLLTAPDVLRTLPSVYGRERELSQLTSALVKFGRANVIIVGPAGVGKTTLVYGLAHSLATRDVPKPLRGGHLFELDTNALTAGTVYRGQFEERLQRLLDTLAAHPQVILFVDEIHTLVGLGTAEGHPHGAENVLKNWLATGRIRCIGTTTYEEYRRFIEADKALERRFSVIRLGEPDYEATMVVLRGLRPRMEEHYGLRIPEALLDLAYELSERYLRSRNQPDKSVDLLAEGAARRCVLGQGDAVTPDDLSSAASELSGGVPIRETAAERQMLAQLEDDLREVVVGQDAAVAQVARGVIAARSLTRDPGRPRAVFLFAGPNGVGKTLTAQALARLLFGRDDALVRVDCADLTDPFHAVEELRGVSRWYVHSEQGGRLTSPVWERPYSVVLLDEIEKAHPLVWNALLPMLDEGRMEDGSGRMVDFTETYVIMTTNACSHLLDAEAGQRIGFRSMSEVAEEDPKTLERLRRALMEDGFPPEFIGRIHRIVVFRPLDEAQRRVIVQRELETLATRLMENEGKRLIWSEDVVAALAAQADPGIGARGLLNVVRDRIGGELSERSINDPEWERTETVVLALGDDEHVDVRSRPLLGAVLVVDDEIAYYERFRSELPDYDWQFAGGPTEMRRLLASAETPVSVILLAVDFSGNPPPDDRPGTEILAELRRDHPEVPVVMVTATREPDVIVECFRLGAYDYLLKPVEDPELVRNVLRRISEREQLAARNAAQAERIRTLAGRIHHAYGAEGLRIAL